MTSTAGIKPQTTRSRVQRLNHAFHKRSKEAALTVDPGDDDTFSEGEDHEGEYGAVPVHDLQHIDPAVHDAWDAQEELEETQPGT